MVDINPQEAGDPVDSGAQRRGLEGEPLKADVQAAREKLGEAGQTVRQEAAHFADAARHTAAEEVDRRKAAVTGALGDFADAIRLAGDQLGEKDQALAARMVSQAASGLETLSRTVSEKRPEEMLRAVRDFGRANPTAFLAGAVLAGLALGRFARSSAQHESPQEAEMVFEPDPSRSATVDASYVDPTGAEFADAADVSLAGIDEPDTGEATAEDIRITEI